MAAISGDLHFHLGPLCGPLFENILFDLFWVYIRRFGSQSQYKGWILQGSWVKRTRHVESGDVFVSQIPHISVSLEKPFSLSWASVSSYTLTQWKTKRIIIQNIHCTHLLPGTVINLLISMNPYSKPAGIIVPFYRRRNWGLESTWLARDHRLAEPGLQPKSMECQDPYDILPGIWLVDPCLFVKDEGVTGDWTHFGKSIRKCQWKGFRRLEKAVLSLWRCGTHVLR